MAHVMCAGGIGKQYGNFRTRETIRLKISDNFLGLALGGGNAEYRFGHGW
jgi:hypothetical protein